MIMNGGGCGGGALKPFPSHGGSPVDGETAACQASSRCLVPALWPTLLPTLLPSSINHTILCRQPSNCHHPRCFLMQSMPPLSAIKTHLVVALVIVIHVVIRRRCRRHCCRRCRHNPCFRCYCCHFLADCCLWTLPSALPAAPPPSFVTLFDDIVLPPWALALDNADSC
jgi:hypothetical protein